MALTFQRVCIRKPVECIFIWISSVIFSFFLLSNFSYKEWPSKLRSMYKDFIIAFKKVGLILLTFDHIRNVWRLSFVQHYFSFFLRILENDEMSWWEQDMMNRIWLVLFWSVFFTVYLASSIQHLIRSYPLLTLLIAALYIF